MFSEIVKQLMEEAKDDERKLTKRDFAQGMGVSDSNFANKFKRNTFSVVEATEAMDKLGYDVIVRNRNTLEEYNMADGKPIPQSKETDENESPDIEELMEMVEKFNLSVVLKSKSGTEFELKIKEN